MLVAGTVILRADSAYLTRHNCTVDGKTYTDNQMVPGVADDPKSWSCFCAITPDKPQGFVFCSAKAECPLMRSGI
ncbi:hypothetical protein Btru_066598 [Bulinus truncatus]|nr:hypothetical protein Btru_066598 [Bulinus truncatus]